MKISNEKKAPANGRLKNKGETAVAQDDIAFTRALRRDIFRDAVF